MNAELDYSSAASRHLRAAKVLFDHTLYDDVAYLAGYVAECALKAIIEIAGRPPKIHNLAILAGDSLNLAADLSHAVRRYRIDLSQYLEIFQTRWHAGLRYTKSGFIQESEAAKFIGDANSVYQATIGAMVLDGFLERVPK